MVRPDLHPWWLHGIGLPFWSALARLAVSQAKSECGDLLCEARGSFRWDMAHELQDVVAGRVLGRPSDQAVTLFESMGVALEDIAAAQLVYRKAKEQGIGQELPF